MSEMTTNTCRSARKGPYRYSR